ncbi:MAG: hypothetical protein ABI852_08565 [Gemmatimonadaceae bacterium]
MRELSGSAPLVEGLMTEKHPDAKPAKAIDPKQTPAPRDEAHVDGPNSKDSIHATESKNPHPQGKTRHGGRDG